MKKWMQTALMITLATVHLWAQKSESFQYIFPLHNSTMNARASQIILRPGQYIDRSCLQADLIKVRGSSSGHHSGRSTLSTDQRTIIFKPDHLFHPEEKVTVTLNPGLRSQDGMDITPFSFHFQVTPLAEPINPYKYLDPMDPMRLQPQLSLNEFQKPQNSGQTGDFPNFEIVTPGEPSTGSIFISPALFLENTGYNLMVENSGDIRYTSNITTGTPVDFKVLPNGMLSYGEIYDSSIFSGAGETHFKMMDSTYTVIDDFEMGNGYTADFHEFQLLPNGHALMIAYDVQPVNMSLLVEGGHPGALVVGSIIQELDGDKNVIFQWRSWDHYDITDSYEDLTQFLIVSSHINAIEIDQDNHLLISTMALAEITKINRQTGDIIWRMGGENNQFTFIDESEEFAPIYFMYQHDIRRLDNGNITLFDGGKYEMRPYSRAVEYELDETGMTATKVWEYRHDPDIFAFNMGSVQRLSGGHTLIGWGAGSAYGDRIAVTEVDPDGNVALEMSFVDYYWASYRAFKFDWDGGRPAAEVMRQELQVGNTYVFNNEQDTTGVTLKINAHGSITYNEVWVSRYQYAPLNPEFPGKAPVVLPVRIFIDQWFIPSINADVFFDVAFFQFEDPGSIVVYHREFEGHGLFIPLATTYNPVTHMVQANMTRFGEFIFTCPDLESEAYPPIPVRPEEAELVNQNSPVRLEWTPVGMVKTYSLQVATEAQFSSTIVNETNLTSGVYELESLANNQTYYWRVMAKNDAGESAWCETVSFQTTAPYIAVTVPNGGESWQRGLEHYIRWDDIIQGDVVIELYKNDVYDMLIDTTYNTGGYTWDIPFDLNLDTNYKISIKSTEEENIADMSDHSFTIIDTVTAVQNDDIRKITFDMHQNYPNPFNSQTQITYQIPIQSHVTLKVFDIRGKEVATLVDQNQSPDVYRISFNARDLPSGVYFYKVIAGQKYTQTKKMLFIK